MTQMTTTEIDPAGQYNITVRSGDTFTRSLALTTGGTAINLTNSSAVFTVADTDANPTTLLSLTVGSGVTMGGTAGTMLITGTATQMTFGAGVYAYELDWLQSTTRTTLLAGSFTVIGSVS